MPQSNISQFFRKRRTLATPRRSGAKKTTQSKVSSYFSKRPARLTASRVNYQVAKAVNRAMNKVSENKIVSLTKVDEVGPTNIQTGSTVFTKSFTMGNTPTVWANTTGLTPIGGMEFPLGVTHSHRVGKYIYLQKAHLTMKIDMDSSTNFQFPTDFRVICFKSRRGNNPLGLSNRFDETLFLDTNGTEFGHSTPGIVGTDIMLQPINKKDWVVYSDKKFTMTNPAVAGSTNLMGYAGKYPVNKTLTYNLPYYAKAEISVNDNAPVDLDTNYVIVCYASCNGQDDFASKWEVSLRGSTTFKDN